MLDGSDRAAVQPFARQCEGNIQLAIEELRPEEDNSHTAETKRLDDIEKRLENVSKRQDRLYLAFENEDISYERYTARNRELKDMEDRISVEREQARAAMGDQIIILESPDAVLEHVRNLNRFLRTEEPLRCRPWLKGFVKAFWIEPGKATIQYRIPLPKGSPHSGQTRSEIQLEKKVIPSTRSRPPTRGSTVFILEEEATETVLSPNNGPAPMAPESTEILYLFSPQARDSTHPHGFHGWASPAPPQTRGYTTLFQVGRQGQPGIPAQRG